MINVTIFILAIIHCTGSVYSVAASDVAGDANIRHLSMIGNAHNQYHPSFSIGLDKLLMKVGEGSDGESPEDNSEAKQPERRLRKGTIKASERKLSKGKNPKSTKRSKKSGSIEVAASDDEDSLDQIILNEDSANQIQSVSDDGDTSGRDDEDGRDPCDPSEINLLDYPQWEQEKGYWLGEYTFLQSDGTPFVNTRWNYPYDHYKGFITGEVVRNSYRQRNVFLYPPQTTPMCDAAENSVVGNGVCGTNGNTKVFEADQSATTCSGGDIAGSYLYNFIPLPTYTQLVGKDNALLYQVFIPGSLVNKTEDVLMQSQLTTMTQNEETLYRTRSAQMFDAFGTAFGNPFGKMGAPDSVSYYRERKVEKDEFYEALSLAIAEYDIREDDLCVWDGEGKAVVNATGSFQTCENHLEESFALGDDILV